MSSAEDAQQWERRLRLSKDMFDRTQHRVEMQVKVANGITTVPMRFPNVVAAFNGAYAQQFGEKQSPQWFCENTRRLMLSSDQLPDYVTMLRAGAQYTRGLGDTMVNDLPKGACRAFARPIIMNLPDDGCAMRDLQFEAELKFPFAIQPDTILRFTVQGGMGTDMTLKTTPWIRGGVLLGCVEDNFELRAKTLRFMQRQMRLAGSGGKEVVAVYTDNLDLCNGIGFANTRMDCNFGAVIHKGERVNYGEGGALLTNFTMFWRQMADGSRVLAIGSAVVAMAWRAPPAHSSRDKAAQASVRQWKVRRDTINRLKAFEGWGLLTMDKVDAVIGAGGRVDTLEREVAEAAAKLAAARQDVVGKGDASTTTLARACSVCREPIIASTKECGASKADMHAECAAWCQCMRDGAFDVDRYRECVSPMPMPARA